jgi:hypothetical protein
MPPKDNQIMSSKKRTSKVLPTDFAGSFSDKASFITYFREQL